MLKWILILWPSFLTASFGEIALFALIDPDQLYLMGRPVTWEPMTIYSAGFFIIWALTALTATLIVLLLGKPAAEAGRRPRPQPVGPRLCLRPA